MSEKLERGDVTTISVPTELKERIDNLRGDKPYHEFLSDLVREEIIEKLEAYRAPGETYGDVILAVTRGVTRDPDELELLIESATSETTEVKSDGTVVVNPPWEKR